MSPTIQLQDLFPSLLLDMVFIFITGWHFYYSWKMHVFFENAESKICSRRYSRGEKKTVAVTLLRTAGMLSLVAFLAGYMIVGGQLLYYWERTLSWAAPLWIVESVIGLIFICATTTGFSIRGAIEYIILHLAP